MQINITGFLQGKNAREFMKELWTLLVSAQENIGGIPSSLLEKKKEEIKQRKVGAYVSLAIVPTMYMCIILDIGEAELTCSMQFTGF